MSIDNMNHNSSDKNDAHKASDNEQSSSKMLAELISPSSILAKQIGSSGGEGHSSFPKPSDQDCLPMIDCGSFGKQGSAEKKIYVPSPSDIAPAMLPDFFDKFPKSPELDKVGQAADKLADLMKSNANPEEQKKAWEAYQESAKGMNGNLAALRLELSLYNKQVPGGLGVEYNDYNKQLKLIDYGSYEHMGELKYNSNDKVTSLSFDADKDPAIMKMANDFGDQLKQGVSSAELKQDLQSVLDKMAAAGLDSSEASSVIYRALTHRSDNTYSKVNADPEPIFMVDGKPVHLNTSATFFSKTVGFGVSTAAHVVFE